MPLPIRLIPIAARKFGLALTFSAAASAVFAQQAAPVEIAAVTPAETLPATLSVPSAPGASVLLDASSSSSLPDAPDVVAAQPRGKVAGNFPRHAGKYDPVILPGQTADRLSARDKFVYGIKDSLSPFSIIGWGISAGYEQAVDGSPNYGILGNTRTGKSFAQRLGAAAARSTSETIFGESILAPILHEDPRYYKQGSSRNFFYRVAYAGTRPIFTRTDGGRTTINLQSLGGNLAGSALAQVYYPPINQGFSETMKTFGGSVGGSALGNLASEFLPGILETVHLKKRD